MIRSKLNSLGRSKHKTRAWITANKRRHRAKTWVWVTQVGISQNCLYSVYIAVDYHTYVFVILGKLTSLEGLQKGGLFQSFHDGSPSPRSLADKAGAFCSMICSGCKMVLNCTPKTSVKNTTCPIKLLEFAAETTSTSPNGANENLNIYLFGSSWWAPQALCETHTCTPQMPPRKCTCKRFPFGTSST